MHKVLLLILDGWGIAKNAANSAINKAKTPFIDNLYSDYHHALLKTHGQHVGLPKGQMGNSEVGHINLGAGRIVYQNLDLINKAIEDNQLGNKKIVKDAFNYAIQQQKKIHLIGLVSDGGVHAHIAHVEALVKLNKYYRHNQLFLHAFTDGRDTDPKSGKQFVARLITLANDCGAQVASIIGRYFAMDRDNRYERTKKAYDLLCHGKGKATKNILSAIEDCYQQGITDEFIPPIIQTTVKNQPIATISNGDVVFFFNFRTDRVRQLTTALSQQAFAHYHMQPLKLKFLTMTNYDSSFKEVEILFDEKNIEDTLGEVLAKNGKSQVRIAETEKYPHVTYFFNGGREKPFKGEQRILKNSPKVATYDLKPEMSAHEVSMAAVSYIKNNTPDFVCLNFANPDMVGHTGKMTAAIKACETVDQCASLVIKAALDNDMITLLLADHGNCEVMRNQDGSPNTAHTTNPVPLILIGKNKFKVSDGILADIAPTILALMGIDKPKSMTGKSLVIKKD